MDSSWLEILPLPKSRPGWMAAIFLAILGSSAFWLIQPSLSSYIQETYYIKSKASLRDGMQVKATYPRFIDFTTQYNVEFLIENRSEETRTIETIEVAQEDYRGSFSQRTINSLSAKIKPKETLDYKFPLAVPSFVHNGSLLIIKPEIYTTEYQPDFPLDSENINLIYVDRWSALQFNVLKGISETSIGVALMVFLAVVSVWLTEYKSHQDVWLSTKEGWNMALVHKSRSRRNPFDGGERLCHFVTLRGIGA